MNITNPSLVLVYTSDSSTATIGNQYIIKDSIQFSEQMLNGLESSSSSVQLSLDRLCPEIPNILNAESDIKAVLRDGNTVLWTGYLSDGFSWGVNKTGTSVLRVKIEDIGSKLLEKAYTRGSRAQLLDGTGSAIIETICSAAGITVASSVPTITTPVKRVVKEGEKCKDLLRKLCFELGFVYYFEADGKLNLKKIDCTSVTGITELDKDDLYVDGDKGLQLDKKVRQYKSTVLSFKELTTKSNVLVYKDISGQTDGYPDCKISLTAGDKYPGPEISSYEAQDLEGGAEVIYLTNVTGQTAWKDGGAGSATIVKQTGANSIGVQVVCSTSGTLSKLQATGTIVVVSANSEVSQGEITSSDESNNCYTRDLEWIHTNTDAAPIANMVVDFYKYCNRQFTFRTKENLACGSLVKVTDNLFSSLTVNLLIYGREYSDNTDVITYRAYSVSPFNLGRAATTVTMNTSPSNVDVYIPDSDVVSCNLVVTPQVYYKNLRDTSYGTISFKYFYNGNTTPPANLVWSAVTNTGYSYTVTTDSATEAHISVAHNTTASSLTVSAYVTGMQTATYVETVLTYEDNTEYNKNWGTLNALPSGVVLDGDYFIAGSNFSSYVLGKPYVRNNSSWVNLTANSVENTTRLFNLMSNVMASDLTVPATSAMYAWFGTLIAQDAAIQNLFSKNITILNNGSIHSAAYDDNGSYIGSGPGFYLGADGELKCYSANTNDLNAINANISGNSSFHGSFDCSVIKTTPESPSTYITLNGSVADSAQAKRLTDQMLLNGLISDYALAQTTSPMFPVQIVGVSGISYMQVAYQGGSVQSGTKRYRSTIRFYDSSGTEVNIRNYVTCSKSSNLNWSKYLHSSNYDYGSDTSFHGQWASSGIQIRVLTGLNRLWVDVPNAASAATLSSGMLFKATSATTVGGISCYPLYVKA
jgi:hypothetical protein